MHILTLLVAIFNKWGRRVYELSLGVNRTFIPVQKKWTLNLKRNGPSIFSVFIKPKPLQNRGPNI
jgi:hypothetical protein